jgi:hypothetical protein
VGCRRRSQSAWPSALSVVVVLLAAGCGGGKGTATTTAATPRIPAAVATDLRQRAEAVASALDAGDECAAQARARALVQAVASAVNRKQIPRPLLEPLTSSANDLAARITCTPLPPPAPSAEPKPHEHRPKHEHKPHRKKKGHR